MTHSADELQQLARDHLWGHFSRLTPGVDGVTVIERGEGCYVWDHRGKRYLDGLAGLFTVQTGHGRTELAQAASKQASELAYFPIWTYTHPTAIELAARLAQLAPGNLNRAFFTTGGSEAVESAWKLARQYFKAIGQPQRT
jgi:adenosylmethionine-8-amino-7-oxononanoate aminotransferase